MVSVEVLKNRIEGCLVSGQSLVLKIEEAETLIPILKDHLERYGDTGLIKKTKPELPSAARIDGAIISAEMSVMERIRKVMSYNLKTKKMTLSGALYDTLQEFRLSVKLLSLESKLPMESINKLLLNQPLDRADLVEVAMQLGIDRRYFKKR